MTNLALVSLDDLRILLAESDIKNEVWESEEAANFLKMNVRTLQILSQKGEIPGVKLGSVWKYSSIALYWLVADGGIKKRGGIT